MPDSRRVVLLLPSSMTELRGNNKWRVFMSRSLLVAWVIAGVVAGTASAQDFRTDEGPEVEPITIGAAAARPNSGLLTEPRLLSTLINSGFERFGDTGTPSDGFYFELSNMITGSGFVSIGPGYRHQIANKHGFVD